VPLVIAAMAFAVDRAVKTDTENIRSVIGRGVKAVEEENCDIIEAIVSENYRDSIHHNKEYLMADMRSKLAVPLVKKNYENMRQATVDFTVRIIFDEHSYVHQSMERMLIKVCAELIKDADGKWLISCVELRSLNLQPANWKDIGINSYR